MTKAVKEEVKEEVKTSLKEALSTILGAIVSKIVQHINYVVVFIFGCLLGIYTTFTLANSNQSYSNAYTGCIFLCTYAPIFRDVTQPITPLKPYTKINLNFNDRRYIAYLIARKVV